MSELITKWNRKAGEANNSRKRGGKWRLVWRNIDTYLLLVPGLLLLLLFKFTPMYGVVIAFQEYNIFDGISGSEWVGLDQFRKLMQSAEFMQVFTNTLLISVYKIVLLFPIPVLIALLLNEIRFSAFKRTVQTIIYMPHFLSWVIISGLFMTILSPSDGLVNAVIQWFGGESVKFFMDNSVFRSIVVFTAGWKEVGWNAIIFIAALASIEQEQYEAASIDGASRLRQMWHISLPGMLPTIILMLILRLGMVLDAGTEQILTMYNPTVYASGDVIGTYVYRMGLGKMDYSFSTAVGLFNSVIGFILVVSGNWISRRALNRGIW